MNFPTALIAACVLFSFVPPVTAQDESASDDSAAQSGSGESVETPDTLSGRSMSYDDLARLPYQQLIKIARSDARAKPDADSYKLRIESRDPTVDSEDIELFLDMEEGPLVLVVDNDGFVEVPHREDLLESNPDLVANQPKGSLNIFFEFRGPEVKAPEIEDGKIAYQELFRPLVEIRDEMRKLDPTFGLDGQQQFVLEIETGEEPIKITRDFGSRTYRPNSRGKVYMIMESYLYEENPEVQIPDDAQINVLPASPEEVEDIRSK